MDVPAELRTARLVARLAREEDGPALADAIAETLPLLTPWFKWADILDRFGDSTDYPARAAVAARRYALGEGPTYLLWEGDRVVGEIALGAEGFDVLSYGVWVRRSAARSGYAAEGSRAVLAAAFDAGVEAVEARVNPANGRSRVLLGALGFTRAGWLGSLERHLLDAGGLAAATTSGEPRPPNH